MRSFGPLPGSTLLLRLALGLFASAPSFAVSTRVANECAVAILEAAPEGSKPLSESAVALLKKDAWPEKVERIDRLLATTRNPDRWSYQREIVGQEAIYAVLSRARIATDPYDCESMRTARDRRGVLELCGLSMVAHELALWQMGRVGAGTEFTASRLAGEAVVTLLTGGFAYIVGNFLADTPSKERPEFRPPIPFMEAIGQAAVAITGMVTLFNHTAAGQEFGVALVTAEKMLLAGAVARAAISGVRHAYQTADTAALMNSYYFRSLDAPGLSAYWEWVLYNRENADEEWMGRLTRPEDSPLTDWWESQRMWGEEMEVAFALDTSDPEKPRMVLLAAEVDL